MKRQLKKLILSTAGEQLKSCALPVFLTHGVIDSPGSLFSTDFDGMPSDTFEKMIISIKEHFDFIFLNEAFAMAEKGDDLNGKCALTFDDGYACLAEYAFPILETHNIPATVFIISDLIDDRHIFWRDQIRFLIHEGLDADFLAYCNVEGATNFKQWSKDENGLSSHSIRDLLSAYFDEKKLSLPNDHQGACKRFYLTTEQIKNAPDIIDFGNHTASHPVLPTLQEDAQRIEIEACRDFLKGTERDVPLFCLPFGAYNGETLKAARDAGYSRIVYHSGRGQNTQASLRDGKADRYTLPSDPLEVRWRLFKDAA